MNEKENKIKEKRTIEATRKGYMGINGKLGVIVKIFGQPIIAQSSSALDVNYLETYEDDLDLSKIRSHDELLKSIPVEDLEFEEPSGPGWTKKPDYLYESHSPIAIGWRFDGLSRGMHLEIIYKEFQHDLVVYYKGYEVFKEIAGELKGFAPLDEWEGWVGSLFKAAVKLEKKNRRQDKEQSLKEAEKKKQSWLQKIRLRWGV